MYLRRSRLQHNNVLLLYIWWWVLYDMGFFKVFGPAIDSHLFGLYHLFTEFTVRYKKTIITLADQMSII